MLDSEWWKVVLQKRYFLFWEGILTQCLHNARLLSIVNSGIVGAAEFTKKKQKSNQNDRQIIYEADT